jgi:hypothetical protein
MGKNTGPYFLLMQQLESLLHNVCYGIPLLELDAASCKCSLWKSDAAFLWLPICKQNNWNMFIHTYSNHHHISQQIARKMIQRLINVMFSPVMVDTLQYCSSEVR